MILIAYSTLSKSANANGNDFHSTTQKIDVSYSLPLCLHIISACTTIVRIPGSLTQCFVPFGSLSLVYLLGSLCVLYFLVQYVYILEFILYF